MTLREIITITYECAEIASCLLILGMTLATAKLFWPRYIKQKRLDIANENAWRVLTLLDMTEEAINTLFWAYKLRKSDEEQYPLQANLILALKKLRTGLLVLRKTVQEASEYLEWLDSTIKNHQTRIRAIRKGDQRPYSASTDLLEDLAVGSYSSEEPNLVKFEQLRKLIASIAGIYLT